MWICYFYYVSQILCLKKIRMAQSAMNLSSSYNCALLVTIMDLKNLLAIILGIFFLKRKTIKLLDHSIFISLNEQ